FDLHGHGASEGEATSPVKTEEFLDDVIAAYDFLIGQNGVDRTRLGMVGASFGGYLSAILTLKRPVRWLALPAPADCPNGELGSAYEALRQFPGELFLIESEHDEVIPHGVVMGYRTALGDSSRVRHEVIRGATHQLTEQAWQQRFLDLLIDWFGSKLA